MTIRLMRGGGYNRGLRLLLAALCGAALAVPEAVVVCRGGGDWLAISGAVALVLSAAALVAAAAALVADLLLLLLVTGGAQRAANASAAAVRWVMWEDSSPDLVRRLLGLQMALASWLLLTLPACYLVGLRLVERMQEGRFAVLAAMLAWPALGLTGAALARMLYRTLVGLLAWLALPERPWPTVVVLFPALLALVVGLVVGGYLVIDLAGTTNLAWMPQMAVIGLAGGSVSLPLAARLSGRHLGLWPWLALTLPLALFWLLGNLESCRNPVLNAGHQGRMVLSLASEASDLDRDGYGFLFGGTDCAPLDSVINPGARELPGNLVDENCNGADGQLLSSSDAHPDRGTLHRLARLLPDRPHILLITWDAARADRFSCYGHTTRTTPNIDRLAAESALFLDSYAPGPNTHSSIPALLSGKNTFAARLNRDPVSRMLIILDESNLTFAELLKSVGYRTAAIVSHRFFAKAHQWDQGFDHYAIPVKSKTRTVSSPRLVHQALKVIRQHEQDGGGQPLFLWVHFYDPHSAYITHDETPFPTATREQRYDSELWFTDRHSQQLIERMRELPGKTVIIMAADHGEELGEHGQYEAHRTLHRENLHVPLIVHVPGARPQRVAEAVSLIDIYPTLADIAGAVAPEKIMGVSLVRGVLDGTMAGRGPVFSEVAWRFEKPPEHWVAVSLDGRRLMHEVNSGLVRYFDIRTDPYEQFDLNGRDDPFQGELEQAVARFLEISAVPGPETTRVGSSW